MRLPQRPFRQHRIGGRTVECRREQRRQPGGLGLQPQNTGGQGVGGGAAAAIIRRGRARIEPQQRHSGDDMIAGAHQNRSDHPAFQVADHLQLALRHDSPRRAGGFIDFGDRRPGDHHP